MDRRRTSAGRPFFAIPFRFPSGGGERPVYLWGGGGRCFEAMVARVV